MQMKQHILFLVLLSIVAEGFTASLHYYQSRIKRSTTDECCVSAKINVGTKKANNGRAFFRQLATEVDSYKHINPENICNLIHFFIQQASMNNKSISFGKGSSNL